MYENFFRFMEKPFSLTPDPKFLYLSKQHQGALEHMLYGVTQREGFMTMIGDVGTGKTTLCRCLLDRLDKRIKVALILNPLLSDMDLLRTCVHDLRISCPRNQPARPVLAGVEDGAAQPLRFTEITHAEADWVNRAGKKELLDALNEFLLDQHRNGGSTVLIIDEAQNLSLEVMEQLRILSNLETEKEKLLQIIFVGQLELNEKLRLPALKQLNQRISVRYEIAPLSKDETKNYISHRVMIAGAGSKVMFARGALNEIYNYSRGYPRLINLVCDRSLLAAYNAQSESVTSAHVRQAIRSLLGEEDNKDLFSKNVRSHAPVAASAVFFLAGLVLFIASGKRTPASHAPEAAKEAVVAPLAESTPMPVRSDPPAPVKDEAPTPEAQKDAVPENPPSLTAEAGPGQNEKISGSVDKPGELYRIQVYNLDSEEQAQSSTQKLQDEGFPAFSKKVEVAGKNRFVVYLGPFKDVKSANIHLNALKYSGRKPMLYSVAQTD